MANLTPEQITTLIGKLKTFPYLVSVGQTGLAPLDSAPTIDSDIATADVTLYETEGNVEASYLTKNDVTLTINTRNVDDAMSLITAIAKGDNIYASTAKKTITLVPITASTSEKTITFTDAYLDPGASVVPNEGRAPNAVKLVFHCKANATTGKPFTYTNGGDVSGA